MGKKLHCHVIIKIIPHIVIGKEENPLTTVNDFCHFIKYICIGCTVKIAMNYGICQSFLCKATPHRAIAAATVYNDSHLIFRKVIAIKTIAIFGRQSCIFAGTGSHDAIQSLIKGTFPGIPKSYQPFTAPAVIPFTNCFCTIQ